MVFSEVEFRFDLIADDIRNSPLVKYNTVQQTNNNLSVRLSADLNDDRLLGFTAKIMQ